MKQFNLKPYATLYALFSVALLLLTETSCLKNNKSGNYPYSVLTYGDPNDLHVLYCSNADMQTICNNAPDSIITFNFLHDNTDHLTLDAWPVNSNAYSWSSLLPLKTSASLCGTSAVANMHGKNVHLGNINVGPHQFDTLKYNLGHYDYFMFKPVLNEYNNTGVFTVGYKVYGYHGSNVCGGLDTLSNSNTTYSLIFTLSPSPPRPPLW